MRKISWLPFAGVLLLLASTWAYLLVTLQYRFGGYDLSPLIDAGWRVLSGQVPNRDFICTFPPVLYLGAAAAFRLFGVHWYSLSIASALYTSSLSLLGLRLLSTLRARLTRSTLTGLGVTFVVLQLLPALLVGHPWHSSWTGAAALYALLSTFALALTPEPAAQRVREPLLHLTLAETLLLLAKPNTAAPALLVCLLTLLLRPHRLRNALLPLASAACLASLILAAVHTTLFATYGLYLQLSSRLGADSGFGDLFANPFVPGGLPDLAVYLCVLPSLVWVLVNVLHHLRRPGQLWICILALGSVAVSLLGLGTDVDFRIVDVSCLLLGAALFAVAVPGSAARWMHGAFIQALFSLFVIAAFYAQTRARMQAVGVWASTDCGPLTSQRDRFFGDFHACDTFFRTLAAADAVHARYPTARIFFGPRMEFLYAREQVPSPVGLPLWWHPGSSYPVAALPSVVSSWNSDRFDVLLFLHDDRTRVPAAILARVQQDFAQVPAPDAAVDLYLRR